MRHVCTLAACLAMAIPLTLGCGSASSGTTTGAGGGSSGTTASGTGGSNTGGSNTGGTNTGGSICGPDTSNPNEVLAGASDPAKGVFTLTDALDGLPDGPGPLRALIDTDKGLLTCQLEDAKVPNAVANFVGLARGLRPWQDPKTNKWVKRRFYDGLLFHRVIPMFMAQGGDPKGDGTGGPGYNLADDLAGLKSVPGTLAYANTGMPNTSGSQIFVTEVATPWLDAAFTYFGVCTPVSVVTALTHVPTAQTTNKPLVDEHIKAVTITRCAP